MGSGLTRARKSGDRNKLKSQFPSENSLERSLTGIFGRPSVNGPLKWQIKSAAIWGIAFSISSPLYAWLDHVACHELEPLVQMLGELRVRPVEIPDEGLKSVQLPEEVLRGGAPVAGKILIDLILNYGKWRYFGRDEFSFFILAVWSRRCMQWKNRETASNFFGDLSLYNLFV